MIEVQKIAGKSPDFAQIKRVYTTVFPRHERLPLALLKMRAAAGKAEFCSIYNRQNWVGFFYTVHDRRMAYVFFLAIDPHFHGQGYGNAALTAIKDRYADKLITLSTERPNETAANNEQRLRRHRFYAQNGFIKTGYYTVERDAEEFDLLATRPNVNPQIFQQLLIRFLTKQRRHYLPFKLVKEADTTD